MADHMDDLPSLFAEHGLRFTRQRSSVYQALYGTDSHPTADELFRLVSRDEQGISLATVYNTLEAFCRCGLAQKLATDSTCARYDASMHNHLHLRNHRTGEVADVPDDLGKQLLERLPHDVMKHIEEKLGFRIQQVKIEFVGENA